MNLISAYKLRLKRNVEWIASSKQCARWQVDCVGKDFTRNNLFRTILTKFLFDSSRFFFLVCVCGVEKSSPFSIYTNIVKHLVWQVISSFGRYERFQNFLYLPCRGQIRHLVDGIWQVGNLSRDRTKSSFLSYQVPTLDSRLDNGTGLSGNWISI